MRTDNGAPFASRAVAGLSRLAVWWMKLGIVPERIAAGHPEQNGRHERMHRTLKQETASPPAAHGVAQQRAFDRFRREYNEQRPHEALGMETPSAVYTPSARAYPARVAEPEYGSALQVRRVQHRGWFRWKSQEVFLSETLRGENIGLLPIDERFYTVYFAAFPIARFDGHQLRIVPRPKGVISARVQGKGKLPLPLHPIPSRQRRKKCQECARSKMSGMIPAIPRFSAFRPDGLCREALREDSPLQKMRFSAGSAHQLPWPVVRIRRNVFSPARVLGCRALDSQNCTNKRGDFPWVRAIQ